MLQKTLPGWDTDNSIRTPTRGSQLSSLPRTVVRGIPSRTILIQIQSCTYVGHWTILNSMKTIRTKVIEARNRRRVFSLETSLGQRLESWLDAWQHTSKIHLSDKATNVSKIAALSTALGRRGSMRFFIILVSSFRQHSSDSSRLNLA